MVLRLKEYLGEDGALVEVSGLNPEDTIHVVINLSGDGNEVEVTTMKAGDNEDIVLHVPRKGKVVIDTSQMKHTFDPEVVHEAITSAAKYASPKVRLGI